MIIDDDKEKHEFQDTWLRKRFITGSEVARAYKRTHKGLSFYG